MDIIRIDLGGVNSYLAKTENGCILFDTGGPIVTDKHFTNRSAELQNGLDAAGCTEGKLKLIVLTHGDYDHTWNAFDLKTRYNVPVAIHAGDRKLVEDPTLQGWMEGFQYRTLALRMVFQCMRKTIHKVTLQLLKEFSAFTPDLLLNDGFDLSPYGLEATVIPIPGHTQGSIAVLTKDGGLIAGDIFSNLKKPEKAANALDFTQLNTSIKKLGGFPVKMVYPGHGAPFAFDRRLISD